MKNGVEKNPNRPRFHQVIGAPVFPPPLSPDGTLPREKLDAMAAKSAQWMEDTIAFYQAEEAAR